ncbi:MAG: hypothetical protein QW390_01685 [Candidatus Bathyarchaeia archaeon]
MVEKAYPKARFSSRLPNGDFLTLSVWQGKKDPLAEVITIQIRHPTGSSWETVGRLAVYRSGEGAYNQLPDRPRPPKPDIYESSKDEEPPAE